MSIRHEQLNKNVEISRGRVDHARKQQEVWRKRHAISRKFTVASISAWTFTITTAILSSPTWLLLIFMFVGAVCFGVCLRGMTDAKEGMKRWRETELTNLSTVTEDIQALVERETLQLMDPKAYAFIEAPLERPKPVKKPRETYEEREMRAALELKEELKKAETALRLKTMQQLGMPISYSSRNQYVTQTVFHDGKLIKKYINVDTGKVELERVERW